MVERNARLTDAGQRALAKAIPVMQHAELVGLLGDLAEKGSKGKLPA